MERKDNGDDGYKVMRVGGSVMPRKKRYQIRPAGPAGTKEGNDAYALVDGTPASVSGRCRWRWRFIWPRPVGP